MMGFHPFTLKNHLEQVLTADESGTTVWSPDWEGSEFG